MVGRRLSKPCRFILLVLFFLMCQTVLIYFLLIRPQPSQAKASRFRQRTSTCVNKTAVRSLASNHTKKCKNKLDFKAAYVFYITNSMPAYECYIYVLLHQLQFVYPCYENVDYLILYEKGYKFQRTIKQFRRVKFKEVQTPELNHSTKEQYYAKCYLKLEVFSLYEQYDKVVFVDADGLFTKDPSTLFNLKLSPERPVSAAYAYWFFPQRWLTSSIFVAQLNVSLYQEILDVYKKDLRTLYGGRQVLDMEIFNWLFNQNNRTKVLEDFVYMDSHYIDEDYINMFYSSSKIPYYVHFSHIKPHLSRRLSSCLDEEKISATPEFFKVHRTFWNYYYLYC